jgi:hypothetical protein
VVSISVEIPRSDPQSWIPVFRSKKVRKNLEIIDYFAGVRYRIDTERVEVEGLLN